MSFFDSNGYFDFRRIRDKGLPFNIILGGRGTGKTYGALRSSIEDGIRFAFMRRKQKQLDIINRPEFSPVRPICRDTGLKITMRPTAPGLAAFVPYELDGEEERISGPPYGYTLALSTVSNLRGFDASDVDILIYDEAIPEKTERPLKHEADALFNCYETLNRNRELSGRRPLQLFCLANANDQTAPILEALQLVRRVEKMRKSGQELYIDHARGLLLLMLEDSPISKAKEDTALYRLTTGSDFAEMALSNDFAYEERGRIRSRPLTEFRPVVGIGDLTIYRHKSDGSLYGSTHRTGSPPVFGIGDTERARFLRSYGSLWEDYMADKISFEDYYAQVLFDKVFR